MIATLAGMACALLGRVLGAVRPLYQWSWFVGFGVAGGAVLAADAHMHAEADQSAFPRRPWSADPDRLAVDADLTHFLTHGFLQLPRAR